MEVCLQDTKAACYMLPILLICIIIIKEMDLLYQTQALWCH